ncbi:MAG: aminotransferase class I/II-fold pyridoxal phosphate-dependent enzyme [Treponema sp.]|nr:aminotransferase class I/II-fold pyridoxal phosphate-dependent enzyme [Treponema sp.]
MSIFWNKRTSGLSPYIPGEQPKDRKFIKLNTNENPYPPSPRVVEAILSQMNGDGESLRLYPDPLCSDFREAVAAAYGVKKEQVFPGNGSDEVLAFVFGAFFESGEADSPEKAVLFPDITYSFYPVYARLWNIPYRDVALTETFSIRVEDYLVFSGGVILPNPNAPTGRALSFGESPHKGLRAIVEYQLARNRVVVVDEAYAVFGAESAVPFINRYPNLLTVHTLSKSASLAGLRAGFAIGSEELIEGLFRVRNSFNSYTMDRLALAAATAAVTDKAYYDGINKKIIATRERTAAALAAMGFEVIPSKANFLFIRWPAAGLSHSASGEISGAGLLAALRARGILVRHFNTPRVADYLRVSVGTDADMDAFLKALKDILEQD